MPCTILVVVDAKIDETMCFKPIGIINFQSDLSFFSSFFNFFNVYLFLRERQSMSGGGAERERETESEAGSRP